MIDYWQDYIEKLRRFEIAAKLVAFHTREAARATKEASFHVGMTAYHIRNYLKDETADELLKRITRHGK